MNNIEQYINHCKLRANYRSQEFNEKERDIMYNIECTKCLEKYYMKCLKDVYDYNHYTNYTDRKNVNLCEKIIDCYVKKSKNTSDLGVAVVAPIPIPPQK
jgi:hypothetical protein